MYRTSLHAVPRYGLFPLQALRNHQFRFALLGPPIKRHKAAGRWLSVRLAHERGAACVGLQGFNPGLFWFW